MSRACWVHIHVHWLSTSLRRLFIKNKLVAAIRWKTLGTIVSGWLFQDGSTWFSKNRLDTVVELAACVYGIVPVVVNPLTNVHQLKYLSSLTVCVWGEGRKSDQRPPVNAARLRTMLLVCAWASADWSKSAPVWNRSPPLTAGCTVIAALLRQHRGQRSVCLPERLQESRGEVTPTCQLVYGWLGRP